MKQTGIHPVAKREDILKMEIHITCTSILHNYFSYYSMKRNFSNSFVLLERIIFDFTDQSPLI